MGPIKSFNIIVDSDLSTGRITPNIITGHVVLKLKQDISTKYMRVVLYGRSKCEWGDDNLLITSLDKIVHGRVYIDYLYENGVVIAGEHSIPFSFELNQNRHCPSSFNPGHFSHYGDIRYRLTAEINRIGAVFDDKVEQTIKVFNPERFTLPEIPLPFSINAEGTDGKCFPTGLIELRAIANKSKLSIFGGECEVTLNVDNSSNTAVTPMIYLVQKSAFIAESNRANSEVDVIKLPPGKKIPAHSINNVSSYTISLAGVDTCGTITTTENISVTYAIKIKLKGSTIREYIPVTVGILAEQATVTSTPTHDHRETQSQKINK